MTEQQTKELIHASQLMRDGKYEKALETIINFEKKGAFTPREQLSALLLKGRIYSHNHQYEDAVKVGELAYQSSQRLGVVSESISALILKAQMVFIGKFENALQAILEAERLINSFPEDSAPDVSRQKANVLYLKAWIYFFMALNEDLEIAMECLELRKKTGNRIGVAYTLLLIGYIYVQKGENNEALDYAKKSLEIQKELNNQVGVARTLSLMGTTYMYKGDLDLALKYNKQSLSITEISGRTKIDTLQMLGGIHRLKGELDSALNYFKQSISLADELNINDLYIANLMNIGSLYRIKGDYDMAIKYLTRSLAFFDFPIYLVYSLLYLIMIYLDRNNPNQAKQYLSRLKALKDQTKSKVFNQAYHFAEAMVLKSSGRSRKRAEAEALLKQICEEEIKNIELSILSTVSYCDFLLEELSMSNDPEILDEIKPIITRLLNVAEEQRSFLYLTETKLLQAKLALIQIDPDKAKILLTQAQQIAEDHGLNLLAQKISSEHDVLLEKIDEWDKLRKEEAPMADRIELASIDGVIDRLQGKSAIEPPDLVEEESILLLIMDNSGATYFNHSFAPDWDYSDLFSSFMSAFNTFMDEIFSKSIDRIRVGENTILINPMESFLTCYVIKGQSYPALQKLTRFTEAIRENSEIWQALNKSVKTSEMLELDKPPALKTVINEIFTF
jgi:tetratricopeptide (TPR) repeat protein